MGADVRLQIVAGAADLIRRRGLAATSIRGLAEHAAAPLGSTYHYFPGGKQQLAAEAVRFAGDQVASTLRIALEAGPVDGLRAFLALWRKILTQTDFRAGCPVLVVAVEEPAGDESAPREAAAEVFRVWEELLADALRQHGAEARDAEELATLVVAAVEGAVAMCRAQRDPGPLDRVATRLEHHMQMALRALEPETG
jgi:AcrR family transcriptional regulator